MARFPSEPRHARVLMEAASRNCLELVAVWMAICDVGRIKTEIANERLEFERLNMLEKPTSEFDELSQLIFPACLTEKYVRQEQREPMSYQV